MSVRWRELAATRGENEGGGVDWSCERAMRGMGRVLCEEEDCGASTVPEGEK